MLLALLWQCCKPRRGKSTYCKYYLATSFQVCVCSLRILCRHSSSWIVGSIKSTISAQYCVHVYRYIDDVPMQEVHVVGGSYCYLQGKSCCISPLSLCAPLWHQFSNLTVVEKFDALLTRKVVMLLEAYRGGMSLDR